MPVKPGDNFSINKFYQVYWDKFWPICKKIGYTTAINRAIQSQVDNSLDIITIVAQCKIDDEFKRRLKKQLDTL